VADCVKNRHRWKELSIVPCGADVEEFVAKIMSFVDAGFTEIGLVQIGGEHQEKFIAWAQRGLLPALRKL
jgi:hypothetical protein